MSKIIVAGNGPSSQSMHVSQFLKGSADMVFRTNFFFMPQADPLYWTVTD